MQALIAALECALKKWKMTINRVNRRFKTCRQASNNKGDTYVCCCSFLVKEKVERNQLPYLKE